MNSKTEISEDGGRNVFVLPEHLNVRGVTELRGLLLPHLEHGGTLTFCANDVATVDTASLQLLAAVIVDLERQGRHAEWHDVSPNLLTAAQALGLQRHLFSAKSPGAD